MPPGFFSLEALERYLRQAYASRALANAFAERERTLLIPAIDLDTAERVVFGAGELRDVPISHAVATIGPLAYPPTPTTTSGRKFLMMRRLCSHARGSRSRPEIKPLRPRPLMPLTSIRSRP